jgi:alpha-N-acetylglucosamine transferase
MDAGWQICQVKRIAPSLLNEKSTVARFRDQFTKLLLWSIDEYDANYYFDADTLSVGNLDEFFTLHTRLTSRQYLGCAQDFRDGRWVETFNMGVFVVRPDKREFIRLLALKNDPSFAYETAMSEQGFLNGVYPRKGQHWYDIGFFNNANLAVRDHLNGAYWLARQDQINIIHFTMNKPWNQPCSSNYKEICLKWTQFDNSTK